MGYMPCPLHLLDAASHCLYCGAFSAGFASGLCHKHVGTPSAIASTEDQLHALVHALEETHAGAPR